MKITEIFTESQIDELSALDVGRGIGSALGKTAHGVGSAMGAVKGALDAGRAGFQGGKNFVSGQRVGRTNPRSNTPTNSVGNTFTSDKLDSMADQDLVMMKSRIDDILKTRSQPQADIPSQAQAAPVQTPPSQASSSMAKGTKARGPDGQAYTWQGGAWVNDVNNRLANKNVAAVLNKGSGDNRIKLPKAAE